MAVSVDLKHAPDSSSYTATQRWLALSMGMLCHLLFVSSVGVMFISLYHGLTSGFGHLHGWIAWVANALLLTQFAFLHSWLMTERGRRFMEHLLPAGLGKVLSTTTYATIASLQLLLVFLFWSPSEVLWVVPEGWPKQLLNALYVGSWIYLAKSMTDAGLGVQLGLLGWRSVWKNTAPVYKPFTRTGTFRHVRQPIYLSFSLILWTAPVWTPDHLFAAILWTGYCLHAPTFKEKRYLHYYGHAFARYQKQVPYWLPRPVTDLLKRTHTHVDRGNERQLNEQHDYDVIIIGGGPVGLLLANLLGKQGKRVRVIEKRREPSSRSRAIGIAPPSLDILAQVNLAEPLIQKGVKVKAVEVHGASGDLGSCDFSIIDHAHAFMLSVPQTITISHLEKNLEHYPSVIMSRGWTLKEMQQADHQVSITAHSAELENDATFTAAYVIACDGSHSTTANRLKIRSSGADYSCHFMMADFEDQSGLGKEAHLFFKANGAVESFPLPHGKRRWIVQTETPQHEPTVEQVAARVEERTGILLSAVHGIPETATAFTPAWKQSEVYHDGRVILCGDAAHVMSPIGGQGMNTGFADAEFLAHALHYMLEEPSSASSWLASYDRIRKKASNVAMRRAAMGMKLGVLRGNHASRFRDCLLRTVLNHPLAARFVARWFSMSSIPCRTFQHIPVKQLPSLTPHVV